MGETTHLTFSKCVSSLHVWSYRTRDHVVSKNKKEKVILCYMNAKDIPRSRITSPSIKKAHPAISNARIAVYYNVLGIFKPKTLILGGGKVFSIRGDYYSTR